MAKNSISFEGLHYTGGPRWSISVSNFWPYFILISDFSSQNNVYIYRYKVMSNKLAVADMI